MRDYPARIAAAAAILLPADRREWGAAMTAELSHIGDGASRWRFALGCVRAVLLAALLPGRGAPSVAVAATFILGVAGCLATTAYVVGTWPQAASEIPRGTALSFGGILVAYLWFAINPPHALIRHREWARRGAVVGFMLFLVAEAGRTMLDALVAPGGEDILVGLFLVTTVAGTLIGTGLIAARATRAFDAGVSTSVWAALTCSVIAFNVDLLTILSGFNLEEHIRNVRGSAESIAPDVFMSKHIGGHLAAAMAATRTLPLLAVIFGAIGAAIGRRSRRVVASSV